MSIATTCVTGQPVSAATRCGKSSRSQRELWPGQRRDDHLVEAARVPGLVHGLDRDPRSPTIARRPPGPPRATSPAPRRSCARALSRPDRPGPLDGQQERDVDRAAVGARLQRGQQVVGGRGDAGDRRARGRRRPWPSDVRRAQRRLTPGLSERQLDDLGDRVRAGRPRAVSPGAASRRTSASAIGPWRGETTDGAEPADLPLAEPQLGRRSRPARSAAARAGGGSACRGSAAARPSPGRRSSPW